MKNYQAKLLGRIRRTPTIESFRLTTDEKINFLPGQFLQIIFDPQNLGNNNLNKYLSFSSSPAKSYCEITKRLSASDFSGRLKSLKIEDRVFIKAPMGQSVFNEADKKIGFLIGGIGLTPVVSMIEYIVEKRLEVDVVLIYSNKTEDEIAFKNELDYWAKINPNIKIVYLVTEGQPKDKRYHSGRITPELVKNEMPDFQERKIFLFGPPQMVEAMTRLCETIGCRKGMLVTEKFLGY